MKRNDWNLLVLSAAEGKPLTPAQFQKVLFLLQKRYPSAVPDSYDFSPYNYGPFDAAVYYDAEGLANQGLAEISRSTSGWRTYAATPAGLERAKIVAKEADPKALEFAKRAVDWARGISFSDLVKAIYQEFPEMKANSIFRDEQ
jgi:hypothetical protein